MSARGKKAAARPGASQSTIYAGRDAVGTVIVERKGSVLATDATGKRLGTFRTDREAMAVILAAARETAK
jgi:hypothetical protein